MRFFILAALWLSPLAAQGGTEARVLDQIQSLTARDTRINFSELYNHPEFDPEERRFLGRLYEIFFQIPAFLKSEYESTGTIPSLEQMGASFAITPASVDLLLRVMESDPRVPPLFERDQGSRKIRSLSLDGIEAFVQERGQGTRMTQWEDSPLPRFEAVSFRGRRLSNEDLSGKTVLLYFWFTGCPPCLRIAPILNELDRQFGTLNFAVIGFNADRLLELEVSDADRRAYLEKQGIGFQNLHLDADIRLAFGNVQVFPTLFLVDPTGRVACHWINFQDRPTLESAIAAVLAGD